MKKWTNETTAKGVIKTDLKYTAAFRIIPWPNFCFFKCTSELGENIYQVPFLCTTETKLRVFQFKFLHRRVATNDFLLKTGKKLGNRLMLFLNWSQRHLHISDCRSSQIFWNNVSQWTSKILIWETSLPTHQLFALAWLTMQLISTPTSLRPYC